MHGMKNFDGKYISNFPLISLDIFSMGWRTQQRLESVCCKTQVQPSKSSKLFDAYGV
jgi:hypothetical protein